MEASDFIPRRAISQGMISFIIMSIAFDGERSGVLVNH